MICAKTMQIRGGHAASRCLSRVAPLFPISSQSQQHMSAIRRFVAACFGLPAIERRNIAHLDIAAGRIMCRQHALVWCATSILVTRRDLFATLSTIIHENSTTKSPPAALGKQYYLNFHERENKIRGQLNNYMTNGSRSSTCPRP